MEELLALLFGAAIIVTFSHGRFRRISYEGSPRFRRLISLLTPDKLRARRVVFRAQLFYTLSLLTIYLSLCAYTEVIPFLGGEAVGEAIGATVVEAQALPVSSETQVVTGYSPTDGPTPEFWAKLLGQSNAAVRPDEKFRLGIPPTVSLTIALMMIGLAPSFQFLERADEWLRSIAHRLAGIPTWVINTAEELHGRATDLRLFQKSGLLLDEHKTFLIPIGDVERMKRYREKSKVAGFPEEDDLWTDLQLIFAVSAWILEGKVPLNESGRREAFVELEEALRSRKKLLISTADGLARKTTPAATDRTIWEQVAQDADALADDLCILIALFVEHDFIIARDPIDDSAYPPSEEASSQTPSPTRQQSVSQSVHARQKLLYLTEQLRTDIHRPEKRREMATVTLFWVVAVTILFQLFWSLLPGAWEIQLQRGEPQSAYWRLINYEFTAFSIYILPVLVGLSIRESRWETSLKWENFWHGHHWTRIIPQAVAILLFGTFAALLVLISVVVWQAGLTNENSFNSWNDVAKTLTLVRRNFEYNGPQALRGAFLALLVLCLLDARQKTGGVASAKIDKVRATGTVNHGGDNAPHTDSSGIEGERSNASNRKTAAVKHHRSWNMAVSFLWALSGGMIMFCVGIVTRYLTYLASSPAVNSVRRPFDSIDAGLALYTGIHSFILAFLVLFCVSEALFDRTASFRRHRLFYDGEETFPDDPGARKDAVSREVGSGA